MYNKLLDHQLQEHFGKSALVPGYLRPVFQAISDVYDRYERDGKLSGHVVDIHYKGMAGLHNNGHSEKGERPVNTAKEGCYKCDEDKKPATGHIIVEQEIAFQNGDGATNKTTKELALSESLLARAQQLAQLGSWELSFADNVLTLSVEGCRIFGLHPNQNRLSSDTWRSLVHPDDIENVLGDIKTSMDSLQDTVYQHRIILADGTIRHINSESKFELDKQGKPVGMYGTMQDVTEKIHDQELREFEKASKEALINNTDDLIWSVSNDFKLIAANKAFIKGIEAMSGITLKPGDDLPMKDIFSGDDLVFWEGSYKKVLAGESLKEEVYSPAFDNWKESWADIRFNPVYRGDTVVAIVCYSRNITERKSAEKKINASEWRYRSLVEQASDAICIMDASMKFIDINPYALGMFGYTQEEALELSLPDILFAEDIVANPIKLSELKFGNAVRNERRIRRKDGTAVDMAVSTKLMEDGRLMIFGHDITERKKSEENLKESEKRLRQIIDLVPHFIFAKDAKGKFVLANEAVAEVYGCTVEDMIGKSDADYNSIEGEVEYFMQEDFRIINSGITKYNIEETITDSAGNIRILSTTKIPYTSAGCDTPGVLGVSVDISEYKKAEAVLKENEGQLSIATQIAMLGYWEFDVTKNLFKFNDQFYSIFKTTAEAVGGYTMSSERFADLFVHPDDIPLLVREASESIKSSDSRYSRQIEYRIKFANGGIGYVLARFFILKNELGRTIKTFGAIQDITDRKKAEETLLRSEADLEIKNKQLQQKNKELEQFAFVASHDMQEPLRTTSSFVDLLQKQYKGKLDEKADRYLNFISQSSDRMKVLIKDLLDYSRIGRKKELDAVDCNIILQEVFGDLGCAIKETGAKIEADRLPVIKGYSTEIKQLFQNLVANAIKFRRQDKAPYINIGVEKKGGCWEFTFKDNGIGIEERHMERVFIIFQRLHNRKEYEGSGIGLAHCKKIVELHGGKIWIESKPGEGSTFYFTLPVGE